jgi:hypothetical protein
MSQTISEQMKLKRERQLQRIERANPDHFRFPRETPRSNGASPSSPTGASGSSCATR